MQLPESPRRLTVSDFALALILPLAYCTSLGPFEMSEIDNMRIYCNGT